MPGLKGDVNIPGAGKFPKIAVVAGVGGVIALIIYERRKKAAAAAAAPSGTGADPYPPDGTVGNPSDPNSTDPSTGATYGDEAAGYAAAGQGLGDLYGTGYGGGGGTSGGVPVPVSGGTGGTGGPPFATNADWGQYVLAYFAQQQFSDLPGLTSAISLYLAGQPVTVTQQGYINDAIAIAGQPPVPGPNNMPPSINVSGSPGTTGTVTIPDLAGQTAGAAHNALVSLGLVPVAPSGQHSTDIVTSTSPSAGSKVPTGAHVTISATPAPGGGGGGGGGGTPGPVTGLHITGTAPTHFSAAWNGVQNSTGYAYAVTQMNGVQVASGTVGGTSVTVGGLHPGWTYNLGLQALPGGPGTNIHVTLPGS